VYHFLILAALHGLNEDGVAVDFHHNHDVLVALLRTWFCVPCMFWCICLELSFRGVGRFHKFPKVLFWLWWSAHSFSPDLNGLSLFQLSWGSTSGRCFHLVLASPHSCLLTPSLVKTETVPSSAVLPTIIRDIGKSWKVSACIA